MIRYSPKTWSGFRVSSMKEIITDVGNIVVSIDLERIYWITCQDCKSKDEAGWQVKHTSYFSVLYGVTEHKW